MKRLLRERSGLVLSVVLVETWQTSLRNPALVVLTTTDRDIPLRLSSTCLLMVAKSTLGQRICSPDESVESRDLSL